MAEDALKAFSPGPAPASIPTVDGPADPPASTQTQPSSQQTTHAPPAAHDGDGDTQMISPTGATNPNPNTATVTQGAPPTPDASPRASFVAVQTGPVPLDSPLRTTPIHPSLPSIKVPDTTTTTPNINPITLQPFTETDLSKHGYEKLRAQIFASPSAAAATSNPEVLTAQQKAEISRLRDETANALKQKLDEREARVREIEREMEEKEKIREVERKVFRKKLAGGGREV
ncbi:hypothetical protein H2200_007363 [Cladophialophora chaetospira]|uniref:Uncharacterized protein n=1 Tax=Cladophialophora chaetospira TaxID=386627 RepID=A0AA38X7N3_9EURO|nr:hypothetical protein H2200_007363 [Cladophialophora chaetospira]